MRRKQLYLTEEIDDRLRSRAQAEGRSEAAIVREALLAFLAEADPPPPDPILGLAGIARTVHPATV